MKFITFAVALLVSASTAKHHHHPKDHSFVATLPDVRASTPSEADIAAHEAARAEAAKVKKNP